MSNVLIGIIGVILFVGLALAGALFLCPRFQDTRSTSVGAATVQAVSQFGSAVALSNVEGNNFLEAGADPDGLRVASYLRNVPVNPSGGDDLVILGSEGEGSGVDAVLVVGRLPDDSGAEVCSAIVKQTKKADDRISTGGYPVVETAADLPTGPAGCFQVGSGNLNALVAEGFYAFARI